MGFEASERYCDASLILESIVSRGKVLTPPVAFEGLSRLLAFSIVEHFMGSGGPDQGEGRENVKENG